jgi:hypothetical protein
MRKAPWNIQAPPAISRSAGHAAISAAAKSRFRSKEETAMNMKHGIITLGTLATMALASGAQAQTITPPDVPADIRVDAPDFAFLHGRGVGTQNYECQPVASLGRVDWVLFTPQATLFDDQDGQLTTHFLSPNPEEGGAITRVAWQDSKDTSTVWGRATGVVVVDPDAIPWVRLAKAGTQGGPTGGTTLAVTTFIQRVNTVGGVAPPTGCETPTDIGKKAFVPYTADYFFYKR